MVGDVHAAEVTAGVSAVHDMAIGEDVSEGAFLAKLAVSLCKVLARRALRQRLVRVQKWTGLSSLAGALSIEFAGYVGCVLVVWGTARAGETHFAQVCSMLMAVDASTGHCHGPMSVCASHCAAGELMAEVA